QKYARLTCKGTCPHSCSLGNGSETNCRYVMVMAIVMRPSQSLRLWQQVMLAEVRGDFHDLTMRQMAILLTIYLDPPPHTVRSPAEKLNVSKPVITRALDT